MKTPALEHHHSGSWRKFTVLTPVGDRHLNLLAPVTSVKMRRLVHRNNDSEKPAHLRRRCEFYLRVRHGGGGVRCGDDLAGRKFARGRHNHRMTRLDLAGPANDFRSALKKFSSRDGRIL
jgi:hypothetical protein